MSPSPAETAFGSRKDLARYGSNARLLFVLQMRYDVDDIHSVAESSLIDGGDDKGGDFVYVDRARGVLIVAQGYESEKPKDKAKSGKADSLNTAASWLFSRNYKEFPEHLQTVAYEVQSAIGAGEIECVEFWYVHNLPESKNVRESMKTVENAVRSIIESEFGKEKRPERIVATEVGLETQAEWYEALAVHILVNDVFQVPVSGAFVVEGEAWSAAVTAVRAAWLYELYQKYQERLFSANYREFLGIKFNRQRNVINSGIQDTAQTDPANFWVYNNGISALVSEYQIQRTDGESHLRLTGLSIVNGAQTTGAIGSLSKPPDDRALVPIRFIRCNDTDTIAEIVRFNNSQNPLLPADFKSNEVVQRRLREEFAQIPGCVYLGGRRGIDRIRRHDDLIPSDTCAQALAAFHRRPDVAYHRKAEIWRDDELYQLFFCVHTTAPHVLMAYSLLKAIEEKKNELRQRRDKLTGTQESQFEFLRKRGAIFLLAAAIADCLETILNKKVSSRFKLSFGGKTPSPTALKLWQPIVDSVMPFSTQLKSGVDSGVKEREQNKMAIEHFLQHVESAKTSNPGIQAVFQDFTAQVREH
jgi:hypothetical protein